MQVEYPKDISRVKLDELWRDVWNIVEYLRLLEDRLAIEGALEKESGQVARATSEPEIAVAQKRLNESLQVRIAGVEKGLSSVVATKIPFGKVDADSPSTTMTATVPGITALADGTAAYIRNGETTSAETWTLNVNGLGAKPVYSTLNSTRLTNHFRSTDTYLFVYNSSRVTGGCWDMYYGYNSDTNTLAYQVRTERTSRPLTDRLCRNQFCFSQADGTLVPSYTKASGSAGTETTKTLNTSRAFDPRMPILYYGSTTNVPNTAQPGGSTLFRAYHACEMRYAWNTGTTLQAVKPCYVRCTPQSDGMCKLDGNDCLVQDLPTTEDGKVYIYLGQAYGSTGYNMELDMEHPAFEYKSGVGIIPWVPEIVV